MFLDLTPFENYELSLRFTQDTELWGQLEQCKNEAEVIKLAEKTFKFTTQQEDDLLMTYNTTLCE